MLFPYEKVRKIQDAALIQVSSVIKNKQNLVMHAPTGLGKTVITLAPALTEALKNNLTVFFLTPKHSQHTIAIETLKEIRKKYNVDFSVVDFIGKKWMCPIAGTDLLTSNEFSDYCKSVRENDSCEYYNNVKNKFRLSIKARLLLKTIKDTPLHSEDLCKICKENKLCPFEMACLAAKKAKIIIADYYHLLSQSIRENLFSKTHKELSKSIIILDEAHQVPQKTRDILTNRLSTFTLSRAIKEAKDEEIKNKLKEINKILEDLVKNKISIEETEALVNKVDFIIDENLQAELELIAEQIREKKKRSFCGSVANFLKSWSGPDEGFARILSKGFSRQSKPYINLSYICLNPSLIIKPIAENCSSIIAMSGTMSPTSIYHDLLGLNKNRTVLAEYSNPFPKNNRLSLIVPETSTKFTLRSEAMYKKIGEICSKIVNSIPGNSAIFFPSYKLRDNINEYFQNLCTKTTFLEHQNLNKKEKFELLEKFKEYKDSGAVLLGISAANFAEGIDLAGDFLKGVVVVGLPLAKPDLETKELIRYYEKLFGNGWDYGYIYPAIVKSLQAAGRCIRSEEDRGVIVFVDERYTWSKYKKCFPADFDIEITKDPVDKIKKFFT